MSINLQKEHVTISEVLCSKYCQTTVENDIIVPDICPDVLKILQVTSEAVISQKNIQADKVYVQGIIRINILYVPDGDVIGNVKGITSVQDFSHVIEAKGAKPGMNLSAEIECELPEYTLTNSRKVNVRNKLCIGIKLSALSEIDIATGISESDPIQIRGSRIRLCNSCTDAERDIIIRDRLEVPAGKVDLGEILKFNAKPTSSELRIIDGKAIVKGETKICTLYGSDDEDSSVQFMEHCLPFTEILEIDGLIEGMDGEVSYTVKDLIYEICQDSDGDKRVLSVEITICACVKATRTMELDVIDDAFGLEGEIIINRNPHSLEQLIENTVAQCPLKERTVVPDYLPELQQICDCTATPSIENVSVDNGSVTVNGFVSCNILYISSGNDSPVAGFSHVIPFSRSFDIPGICADSVCDVGSDIEHLSYNMLSAREVELRIIVSLGLKAVNPGHAELIDSIEWNNDTASVKRPSMIIYFVQDGDTLWDIAKRYKTTPDQIIAANGGSENEVIKPGKQLYIF